MGKTPTRGTATGTSQAGGDVWFWNNDEQMESGPTVTDTGKPGWVGLATDITTRLVSAEVETAKTEVAQIQTEAAKQKAGGYSWWPSQRRQPVI